MNEKQQIPTIEKRQQQIAVWIAGTFSILSLIFLMVSLYFVFIKQNGRFDLSDKILMPVTIIMLSVSLYSFWLIRHERHILGTGLLYAIVTLFPPIAAVLVLKDFGITSVSYIILFSIIMISMIVPRTSRMRAIIAATLAVLLSIGIELWDPSFRTGTDIEVITIVITMAAALALATFFVRQVWSGNIRVKIVTSFTLIALISVAIVGTVVYISYRNQVRQDIRQRLINIISITALQQDGDLFATIQTPEDMQGKAYQAMESVNHAILATDRDLAYIFSVRVDEQGQMEFVVDSGMEEGYVPLEVGVVYDDPSELLAENALTLDRAIVEEDFYTDEYGTFLSAYAPIYKSDGTRAGIVGVDIFAGKVIAEERAVLLQILGTTLGTMLVVTLIGLFLGNLFVGPIINLSNIAKKITEGDLSARAKIETSDEIGELAKDFNLMTAQLQETLQGLEQRVADRTRNLELAAEVGRTVSQVRDLDVMLKDACELILKEFNLYYVQVYLTDASGSKLTLEAGTGSVGAQLIERGHSLPLDTGSINGRAAVEKRPVVIPDTTQSATFRKNTLLPETRGEMTVPLIVANKVVGVLDMQSNVPGVLNEEILPAFEALAGQMAVAVQNANLLAETEQARAQVEAQARHLVREGWNEHLDAIHKPEQLGFLFDHNKLTPLAEVDTTQLPEDRPTISAPIAVTGETLGSLVVQLDDETRLEQTSELVNIVARQMAQQIENLRLLESAERYRYEAEKAARLQTLEGWQEYIASRSDGTLGYLYDTQEVRPQGNGHNEDASMFTLPLKARDEMIGKLSVQGLEHEDQESVELANAVAERLSAHIENLRLFEETRHGQFELDKRARQLAAVAEVSSVSSRELDIQKMLESVVHLTQRQFGLYHAHVFTYNDQTDMLAIAACGWEEGDEHEGTHGTTAIAMGQEQSLVARAARNRQAVIVNDVRNEPGWLPNPLLPDTNSELAVPLVIGDRVLGVLDVQSEKLNAFTEEDANIYTTLASQISTSLQNAQSFVQAQQQAERESRLNAISQKIQSATTVEAVLQIAARELGHTLGAPLTIAQLGLKESRNSN